MKEHADIRWMQRFANLVQVNALLEEALQTGSARLNQLEKEGLTQRFEFTFELAWKTLKDYLEESGVQLTISTPREVIRVALTPVYSPMERSGSKCWSIAISSRTHMT